MKIGRHEIKIKDSSILLGLLILIIGFYITIHILNSVPPDYGEIKHYMVIIISILLMILTMMFVFFMFIMSRWIDNCFEFNGGKP